MPIATGHQHRVPGREGTGLTVPYTRLCHMGALAGAVAITPHCHVEGWKETREQPVKAVLVGLPVLVCSSALAPHPPSKQLLTVQVAAWDGCLWAMLFSDCQA